MKAALMFGGVALAALFGATAASAQGNQVCAQGTYSTPCPKAIWCPGAKCGIGIPRTDGDLDIIYSSEKKMDGTKRRPVSAGSAMSLQHLAGRIIVFEWDDSGQVQNPGSDLAIKDILYVIMPQPNAGG